ncbi:MAG: lysophospholipid acyltransferase family protein [Spirochaetota bacterium]
MKTSGFVKGVTKLALQALIRATKADIRTHGEENLPAGPAVYVVNHFTRMETFFLPYIIEKAAGMDLLALAHFSFFTGGFGTFLEKLGAISTRDPERDRKMIGGLLRGDRSCMIFPEGQMVKDKKLVERGKFMIYNAGIRRPPHTGAGLLALRAEFYRDKLRNFLETGYAEGVKEYMEYFGIATREKAVEVRADGKPHRSRQHHVLSDSRAQQYREQARPSFRGKTPRPHRGGA